MKTIIAASLFTFTILSAGVTAPIAMAQDADVKETARAELPDSESKRGLDDLRWQRAVSGRQVYLHSKPELKSALTGTLEANKKFQVGEIDEQWVAVKDGLTGDVLGYASRDGFHSPDRTSNWFVLRLRVSGMLEDKERFPDMDRDTREAMVEATMETLEGLDDQYFEDLNPGLLEELMERVLTELEEDEREVKYNHPSQALLAKLDAHSTYEDASKSQRTKEELDGEFGGVGIEITRRDEGILVIAPIDDGPAVAAGVEAGDFIVAVDGKSVLEESLRESVNRIRGPLGDPVTLTIMRAEQDLFDLVLVRDTIRMRPAKTRKVGDVCVLRISSFSGNVAQMARNNLRDLGDCSKTILDLRSNPGGLLNESIPIAGMFIGEKEVVSIRSRGGNSPIVADNRAEDIKRLVVLINGGSASASEIVSAAIMDQRSDAIIMGTQSFGKGSVQRLIPAADGDYLRLTSALFYRPAGTTVQGVGVKPEIEILPTKEDQEAFEEARAEAIKAAEEQGVDASNIGERYEESSNFAAIQVEGQEDIAARSRELSADDCLKYVKEVSPVTDRVDTGLSCALAILQDDVPAELQELENWATGR